MAWLRHGLVYPGPALPSRALCYTSSVRFQNPESRMKIPANSTSLTYLHYSPALTIATCLSLDSDIFGVTETWLSEEILDGKMYVPGYSLLRLDRNRHGGGIALYVRCSLNCEVISLPTELYRAYPGATFFIGVEFCIRYFL